MDSFFYNLLQRAARNTPALHGFLSAYALWLGLALLALCFAIAYVRLRYKMDAETRLGYLTIGVVAIFVSLGVGQIINHIVERPRPYYTHLNPLLLVPRAHDFSFPSDHATVAGVIVLSIYLSKDSLMSAISFFFGLLLMFARLYVGAHYLSDVLVGFLLGCFVVLILSPLNSRIVIPILRNMVKSPFRFLVTSRPRSNDHLFKHERRSPY